MHVKLNKVFRVEVFSVVVLGISVRSGQTYTSTRTSFGELHSAWGGELHQCAPARSKTAQETSISEVKFKGFYMVLSSSIPLVGSGQQGFRPTKHSGIDL